MGDVEEDRSDQFISGDWGTSRLRLRLVQPEPFAMRAEVESDLGIARVFSDWQASGQTGDRAFFYLRALAPELERLRTEAGIELQGMPLILSGMASSSIGLRELPYARSPFPLSAESLPIARIGPGELPVETVLISGVCSDDDVMRGEETILVGLAEIGYGDGLSILPGTHSKHIDVRNGVLERFRTYLTGELFALLREQSVLRTCLSAGSEPDDVFEQGVRDAREANLLGEAFSLRARSLLHCTSPVSNGQRLSGLLIGTELRDLPLAVADDHPILVAAPEPLRSYYHRALIALGFEDRIVLIPPDVMPRAVALGQQKALAASRCEV